ncbi:MAG: type II toxin-antitoxin system RelE/ParE family toxin [Deltaproteobacteria bacterium]|nr:MAG: type II toxin-antitoxin system RelE/ParE family toxin [Deltaproteobacteria bacterium]
MPARLIEFHPEASQELLEAQQWYQSQSDGLGGDFANEIERAVQMVQESPQTWPIHLKKELRRFLVHRFPFAIVYQYDDQKIRVIAVMHLKRKPGYWKSRYQGS